MMFQKINYGKILIVTFITVLIWVWADLALDEILPDKPATIVVDESANPKLLVSLDESSSVDIRVTLSGPHTAITNRSRELKAGKRLEFDFDAAQEKMNEPGNYTLSVLAFLQKNKDVKGSGLTVESCEPDKLSVEIVELVKRPLVVRCLDEEQLPVKTETINPGNVEMLVPKDWAGEKLIAKVQLMRGEIEQARSSAIMKTPYIELAPGRIRRAATAVNITTPPETDRLNDYTITTATLGFTLSANLQGQYKVEVINLDEVIRAITVRATPEAERAYEKMRYQVILEIDDADKETKSEEPLRKELIYNFPAEYVRKDEIMLNQQPVTARFRLTVLPSVQAPPSVVE